MKKNTIILFFLLFIITVKAQIKDSIPAGPIADTVKSLIPFPDSAAHQKDFVFPIKSAVSSFNKNKALESNLFYGIFRNADNKIEKLKINDRKDWLFYLVVAVLFFMALLRLSYIRYFTNLFKLFFKTTLRQTQLRDQLLQSQLSALLFNIFFFIAAGMYLFLLISHYDVHISGNKWQQLGICIGLLSMLYLLKYIVLKGSGWVFGISTAVDTYIFIVFLINKVLGILLVPFIILIAFSRLIIVNVSLTLSLLMISAMFVYRFIRSYAPIQKDIKVSRFHFFLYLCAFEITPLLLIYKVLMKFF
ncbi:MAG: DUF4271 domain-containing protein [Sphingobacteriales bacterium]|nr:DUF4271 domain-containing protein [Sphingobacteriales bacterium]